LQNQEIGTIYEVPVDSVVPDADCNMDGGWGGGECGYGNLLCFCLASYGNLQGR